MAAFLWGSGVGAQLCQPFVWWPALTCFCPSYSSASLRLAYQDIQEESKKKAESQQDLNPQRAQQFERLGMGTGANRAK